MTGNNNSNKAAQSEKMENAWGRWSGWSTCSKSCNTGEANRRRECIRGSCKGFKEEIKDCNTHICRMLKMIVRH